MYLLKLMAASVLLFAPAGNAQDATDSTSFIPKPRPADRSQITPSQMDQLNSDDMARLREKLTEEGGATQSRQRGDGTLIKGQIECNPDTGLFEFTFHKKLPGAVTWTQYNRHMKCLTSPGKMKEGSITDLREYPNGNQVRAITRMHITSENTSYPGIPMPYSVWLGDYGGYAVHETNDIANLGHPASHGCFRLNHECAKEFYNLVDTLGTENAAVDFKGYNCGEAGLARQRNQGLSVASEPEAQAQRPFAADRGGLAGHNYRGRSFDGGSRGSTGGDQNQRSKRTLMDIFRNW